RGPISRRFCRSSWRSRPSMCGTPHLLTTFRSWPAPCGPSLASLWVGGSSRIHQRWERPSVFWSQTGARLEGSFGTCVSVGYRDRIDAPGGYTTMRYWKLSAQIAMLAIAAANLGAVRADAATNWYAAPDGRPTGQGTLQAPWDLTTALAGGPTKTEVKPGDTIWLRGGTYTGRFNSTLTGTAGAPITVRQYPGERAILDKASGTVT